MAIALFALGGAGLTFKARLLSDDFVAERRGPARDADRLIPLVTALLMESSRLTGLPVNSGSRENLGEISIASLLNQGEKGGCGYNKAPNEGRLVSVVKQRKTLEGHCWLCYSLFRLPGRKLPTRRGKIKQPWKGLAFRSLTPLSCYYY